MIRIILLIHIFLAVVSLAYAANVVIVARKHHFELASSRVKKMWRGTIAATVTGFLLTYTSHAPMGSACISSLSLVTVILLAHYYQKHLRQKFSTALNQV